MEVAIYGKEGCARCTSTKRKLSHFIDRWGLNGEVHVVFHDMGTMDGLVESAFNDVDKVPTTIIRDGERSVARWEGIIPNTKEVKVFLEGNSGVSPH